MRICNLLSMQNNVLGGVFVQTDMSVAEGRITELVKLVWALRVKFYQNIRCVAGLILKELDDPYNRRPQLATVTGFGCYSDREVAFLICAKMVCCSLTALSSLGAMVMLWKKRKIADRLRQIRFYLYPSTILITFFSP